MPLNKRNQTKPNQTSAIKMSNFGISAKDVYAGIAPIEDLWPGVMVNTVGNGHGDTSLNPRRDICMSYYANTLGKDMNPIILPPAMGK